MYTCCVPFGGPYIDTLYFPNLHDKFYISPIPTTMHQYADPKPMIPTILHDMAVSMCLSMSSFFANSQRDCRERMMMFSTLSLTVQAPRVSNIIVRGSLCDYSMQYFQSASSYIGSHVDLT